MKNERASSARAILALAGAAILLGGLFASPTFAEEKVGDKASFSGVSELVVDSSSVDIEAKSVAQGERLRVECRDFPAEFSLLADQKDGRLSLRVSRPETFFIFGFRSSGPRLIIAIPQGSSVELRSASGDISLSGPVSKRILMKTSSGDLLLSRASGQASLESSSGAIRAESCDGGLAVLTSSGDITISDCGGDKRMETSSGSVGISRSSGKIDVSTSSGDIKGRELRLSADSSFSTSSGSIDIGFSNGLSDLRFDLVSRSGSLRAGSSSSDGGKLSWGSGQILVRGSSGSGDQSYSAK